MDKINVLKEIKKDLRGEKNKWIFKNYNFNGKTIYTKRFKNWFQIFRLDNVDYSFPMDSLQRTVLNRIETILK